MKTSLKKLVGLGLLCVMLVTAGFVSVNRHSTLKKEKAEIHAIRMKLVALPIETQKALWITLTPEKRFLLWQDKFDGLLKLNLSEAQRNHLEFIHDRLSPAFFNHGSPESIEFKKIEPNWRKEGVKLFTLQVFKQMMITLTDIDGKIFHATNYLEAASKFRATCECSKESDWCSGSEVCNGTCTPPSPNSTQCGTFWTYYCDGMCGAVPSRT